MFGDGATIIAASKAKGGIPVSIDLDDAFGAYSREELQETLRSMDPKKDPENYAAIKAALSRALPQGVIVSCLDVAALSKLEATIQA